MAFYYWKKLIHHLMKKFCQKLTIKINSFFCHGSLNPCGVLKAYLESMFFSVKEQATDRNGRILILDATIDESVLTEESVLTNF